MWNRYVIRRKMNSLSRRLGMSRAPAFPVRAWIASTSRCNLKCKTCWEHQLGDLIGAKHQDMEPEVYERIRRELLPGLQEVYLSGTGEPFLAPIFYRILDDILPTGKRIWVVTNATIIREDYLERLVRAPSVIMVSLDGTTPEVMDHIRPGARLERVLQFMETVKRLAEGSAHPAFEMHISWVVTRSNVEQLTDCVELAHRYGVRVIAFSSFLTGGRTDEFAKESLMDKPEEVLPHWERARQRAAELGIHVPPIVFDVRNRPEEERRRYQPTLYDEKGRLRQCPIPWWDTYIDVDGSVRPCCVFPVVGNILEKPFRKIWNGPQYRRLRRTVNTPNMPEQCKQCFMPVRL